MTRQEAVEILNNKGFTFCNFERCVDFYTALNCERCEEALKMGKEALEQEPKCGKWIAIDDTHSQCTECGAIFCITSSNEWEVNYCPNCGARMESDDE